MRESVWRASLVGMTALGLVATAATQATPAVAAGKTLTSLAQVETFTNCNSAGQPVNKNLTIAFAQTDLNTPWRVGEMSDFKLWAKKLCIPHFVWNQANESVTTELSNVSDLLARKPNVLILDPEASKPLDPAVQLANKANIPLVVVDRALTINPGPNTYPVFIGAGQFKIGYQSAFWWVHKLMRTQHTNNPKGNLVILEGGVGQAPAIQRDAGVAAALKPYKHLKIVAVQSGDWTLQGGRQVMEAYIQRFPAGSIQGVFAASDEMMLGGLEALKAAHRTDLNGWFFSGDGQRQGIDLVVSGVDIADTQNPPLYGHASLTAAIAIANGATFANRELMMPNLTFTCMTAAKCSAAKAYDAQLHLQNLLF